MRYWDSSALVALLLAQRRADDLRKLYDKDPGVTAWVLTDVEFHSAMARLEREGAIDAPVLDTARREFDALWSGAVLISTVEAVKPRARRALAIHSLTAADALQLGAALTAAGDRPEGWPFVSLDARLNEAARKEGFEVVFQK